MSIQVTFTRNEFICKSTFEERSIPRQAGFDFDRVRKLWTTKSIQAAARLRPYLDESAKNEINRSLLCYEAWTGAVPYPKHLTPLEFQIPAARFALSRNRSYLGLDPGLGKTIVAALIMNARPDAFFLYVCPPFLAPNVENELRKWRIFPTDNVEILRDSMLDNFDLREFLNLATKRKVNKILIVDEAHRFKNIRSNRAKTLLSQIAPHFENQIYMSGTPLPNRPMELHSILSHAAPQSIDYMSRFDYGRHFCAGYHDGFGWNYDGASNMKELKKRVCLPWDEFQIKDNPDKFMLRIKKEVLNLPPKLEEMVFIGDDLPAKIGVLDRTIAERFGGEDEMEKVIAQELGNDTVHLATYRKELGKEKAMTAIPLIKSILEETDENLILCTWHREAASRLVEGLEKYQPILIDGSVDPKMRVPLADKYQMSPDRRVIILNIIAGGIGLNLQKANRVVFIEFSWVPGENEQASDRAHRYGQKGSVLCQYLVYRNSIDRVVIESVLNKRRNTQYV